MLNIALPKGRLGDRVYGLLDRAGFGCPAYNDINRELVIENKEKDLRFFLVKPGDVQVYVEHHAADIGIVGKDILLEEEPDVYELFDMGVGKCRMCVAAPVGYRDDRSRTLRVATKYVNVTKRYYGEKDRDIDIIFLRGSIELGPITGLSDVIVDIVETGGTLKANDLEVVDAFKDISARLIANKSSYKFQNRMISKLLNNLSDNAAREAAML